MRLQITDVDDPTDAFLPTYRGVIFDVLNEATGHYEVKVVDVSQSKALFPPQLGQRGCIPKSYINRGLAKVLPVTWRSSDDHLPHLR